MTSTFDASDLDDVEAFAGLSAAERAELAPAMTPFSAATGQALFRQGEAPGPLFVVTSGRVELRVAMARGERVVAEIGAGDIVGSFAPTAGPRSVTARVAEDVTGFALSRHAFQAALDAYRPAAYALLRPMTVALARRARALIERIAGSPTPDAAAEPAPDLAVWRVSEPGFRLDQARQLEALAAFDIEELDRLLAGATWLDVPRGTTLAARGHAAEALSIVVRGAVQGTVEIGPGDIAAMPLKIPGETLDEVAGLDGRPQPATYRTREHTTLLRLAPGHFAALLDEHDRAAYKLLDVVVGTLERMLSSANRRLVHIHVQAGLRAS